jgi:hypothetical protein
MDCDGQHTIKDAKKLIKEVSQNKDMLLLGKRIRSGKTPIRSRIGNSITRFVYKITTGLDVYDTQTGLRAFSDKLIDYAVMLAKNEDYEKSDYKPILFAKSFLIHFLISLLYF